MSHQLTLDEFFNISNEFYFTPQKFDEDFKEGDVLITLSGLHIKISRLCKGQTYFHGVYFDNVDFFGYRDNYVFPKKWFGVLLFRSNVEV